MPKDPVCGMIVDEEKTAAELSYKGAVYYFCAPGCQKEFAKEPEKYLVGQSFSAKKNTIEVVRSQDQQHGHH
jgi:YHS domain-containing protein